MNYLFNVYDLKTKSNTLKNVDMIVVCCKRSVVKNYARTVGIKKNSIIKQQSVLLNERCLYLFVDKYVDSGAIEHYFWFVNKAFDMTNVKCIIKGTTNKFRKATLRRLLNFHCKYYAESESSSDNDSISS